MVKISTNRYRANPTHKLTAISPDPLDGVTNAHGAIPHHGAKGGSKPLDGQGGGAALAAAGHRGGSGDSGSGGKRSSG